VEFGDSYVDFNASTSNMWLLRATAHRVYDGYRYSVV